MFDMIVITVRRGVPVGADTDAYKGFFTLPAPKIGNPNFQASRFPESQTGKLEIETAEESIETAEVAGNADVARRRKVR